MLLLCALIVGSGSTLGQVVSGTTYKTSSTNSLPTGWSGSDGGGTNYIKLIESDHYIQTSEFAQNGFTSIKLKARKYGGPSDAQALITVSWYSNNTETVLGTIAPTNTTLTDYTISSPTNPTANTTGFIRIQCKGAGSSKGSGVSEVTITYTSSGPTTYTVTYDANGGSGTMTDEDSPYEAGAEVTLLENSFTAPTGYGFNGWSVKDASNTDVEVTEGKFTMPASNVTVAAQWQAYSITAQSNNDSYGTVSLNGFVITANPSNGYTYASDAYTVSSGSATVEQNGNEFTVTPTSDCTVTINFEAIPTYTVTLGDDNSTLTETIGNAGVTLPTRSDIDSYTFVGWSETNVSIETTTAPTIITAGTYYPTVDITLYPVYSKTEDEGTAEHTVETTIADYANAHSWSNSTQYTSLTLDENVTCTANGGGNTGKYYTNGSDWRFYQTENASLTIATTNGTLNSATIKYNISNSGQFSYGGNAVTSGSTVNLSGTSATFTVTNSGSATNGQAKITEISVKYSTGSSTTYYWSSPVAAAVAKPVITLAENPFLFSTTATITCATEGASIKYSFDGENWIDYSEVLTITSTTAIYAKATKGEDGSAVASVTATKNLAEPTVTIDATGITNTNVFDGTVAGSLSATVTYNDVAIDGATVTWSGDNDNVATIDPSTGAVTLVAAGTVTFTATYAENSDYSEKAATYQMTVIYSDPNAPGTENNPYTVEQAIEATPTSGTSANVYIKGIVSKFYNNSIVGDGSNYRYYISDDGTTTNQLLVYKGKGLNNVAFSNADDLQIGDEVVILGGLTIYNKAPEVAQGNYIVSLTQIPSSAVAFADETPSINFPATTTYQQEATAAGGYTGTITYEITENTAGATIEGSTVTVTKEGSVTVKAVAPAVLGAFKKSEATYTLTVTDTRAENGLALANAEQEVIVGETLNAPTLNNPNNLTVTYSSEDVTIATVDESGNVTGVAVGTTTITATFDGNDGFKPGNVSYTLTVKKAPFAITDGFFDFGAGEDYGSEITPSGVKEQTSTWTAVNVTMYMEGRNCWFDGNEIRLYKASGNEAAGSITLSVPTGYVITNIAFTGASLNKMSAAVGTYTTASDNKSATWTGNANSVKFTASERTDIYTIKVTYSEIPATLTKIVTAAGWATYAPTFPVSFKSGEAYIVSSVEDGKTKLIEVASVPAGTPVLLKGKENEETEITMTVEESSDTDVTGNCLKVSNGTAISTNDKPIYVLANRDKGVGFYVWTGSALSAGKIYLEFSESTSRSFFALPGSDLTGIDDVTVAEGVAENVFDLQGRRVAKATKGLYIVNGKKTVIK